jgi:hypothetical protein
MMVRKLFVAGLVTAFGLMTISPEAQARSCRRIRCCQTWQVGYQPAAIYQQPMASSGPMINGSFASTCCNPQPACIAPGFQGTAQGFQVDQNGQYQSGYQQNGAIAPQPMNDDPNLRLQQPQQNGRIQSQQDLRVRPQQGQQLQQRATQPPQERQPQTEDQRAPQSRNERAPQPRNESDPAPDTEIVPQPENDAAPQP